jgi:hypothetical protein
MPVATPVRVTRAPLIAAPVGSSAVPVTVRGWFCAWTAMATARAAATWIDPPDAHSLIPSYLLGPGAGGEMKPC